MLQTHLKASSLMLVQPVVGEATTQDALDPNVVVEHAVGSVNNIHLEMLRVFGNQYLSKYLPCIFPASLNFHCGGADYPDLFAQFDENDSEACATAVRNTWRRIASEAVVKPGVYTQMVSTRAESQLAKDWFLVPAARNLHWRWKVLRSSFLTCKQKVKPGKSQLQNL